VYFRNYLYLFSLCNRQVFENISRMLRPDGTMLISIVTSQEVFNVFELISQNMEFSPYMEVNIIIYNMHL